jgi:hypothetical protein
MVMNSSTTFVDAMRRTVRLGHIRDAIGQVLVAFCFATFGSIYLAFASSLKGYLTALAAMAGGIAWIVFAIRGVIKPDDPFNTQIGAYGPPEVIAREVEQEFAGQSFRPRRIYVGRQWLCYAWKKELIACRIDTIVWAYREQARRRNSKGIPLRTSNRMVAWRRDGHGVVLPLRKVRDVQLALEALRRAAPWVFVGYTDALKESWNNDREDLVALSDDARGRGGLEDGGGLSSSIGALLKNPGIHRCREED